VEGLDFSVRSTDEGFLELVRGYLGPFRVEDGPEDINFQADCGTARILPGGLALRPTANLYLGRLRIYCGPRWEDMAGRLVAGVRDMMTAHANEFLRLRAAGAVVDGRALILPSAPNPHLPAMAALLTQAGAGYLGDEVVYLDPILRRIHGIPLPILVDVPDLRYFPDLAGRRGRWQRQTASGSEDPGARTPRRPIPVEEIGGHHGSAAPLGWIVFPSFRPGETTRVEPVGRSEALFGLMESMLNAHVWADRALILFRELVEAVPAMRLIVGSLPEGAELLKDLPAQVARSG
jgi:hypothetical protein